jgi:hypothetical protein
MGFFDVSFETANKFYTLGWIGSLIGAAITLIAVFFLMWGTRVRDIHFEHNIANLHGRAATSEERSKILEQGNLTLQREAERERTERLKLEAKVAPCRLAGEQKNKIIAVLSATSPAPVAVVSRLLDWEGKDFADDLALAIKESHWQAARYENWTKANKGVFVALAEGTPEPYAPQVKALKAALDAANIECKIITIGSGELNTMSPPFEPRVLYLLIGAKPS